MACVKFPLHTCLPGGQGDDDDADDEIISELTLVEYK